MRLLAYFGMHRAVMGVVTGVSVRESSNLGSQVSNFISANSALSTALTGIGVILIVLGVAYAVIKHHGSGAKAVLVKALEYVLLGVLLVTPTIWGNIATVVANVVGGLSHWAGTL